MSGQAKDKIANRSAAALLDRCPDRASMKAEFHRIRLNSVALTNPLEIEDQVIQTSDETSPTKWHLAHMTWFFETLVLNPLHPHYQTLNDTYDYLFNSYYQSVGPQYSRPRRGFLTRPTVSEVHDYRAYVERSMEEFFANASDDVWQQAAKIVEVGLHHEQQHQELILTDIKEVLSHNPLMAAPYAAPAVPPSSAEAPPLGWTAFEGGLYDFGHDPNAPHAGFAFDSECPRHKQLIRPFELASRPVTTGEFLQFVEAGGYDEAGYWLSDGWAVVEARGWRHPAYWHHIDNVWHEYTLAGLQPLNEAAPVAHVSFYEAAAYAAWAGLRLPTEFEWELAANSLPIEGNLLDFAGTKTTDPFCAPMPRAAKAGGSELTQMFGDVWEWTQTPFLPYPGFQALTGALGEYNGKFMCNQMVLRGGSCATPRDHIRQTYRNFFFPDQRWQFSGFRLARDLLT